MPARRLRTATLLAASLTVLVAAGCVRGRNDGGRDGAGLSSNGSGPAPQPGPLAGENKDTTMIPAAAPTAAGGTSGAAASGTSTNAASGPGVSAPSPEAKGAAKKP
jgi:hypothetical protein